MPAVGLCQQINVLQKVPLYKLGQSALRSLVFFLQSIVILHGENGLLDVRERGCNLVTGNPVGTQDDDPQFDLQLK